MRKHEKREGRDKEGPDSGGYEYASQPETGPEAPERDREKGRGGQVGEEMREGISLEIEVGGSYRTQRDRRDDPRLLQRVRNHRVSLSPSLRLGGGASVQLCSKANMDAEGKRIVSGRYAAEDKSKLRKVALAIGIGVDPDKQHVRHLFVAAHKTDRSRFGVDVCTDYDSGIFYDRDATLAMMRRGKR